MASTNPQYLRWSVPEYHQPERNRNWYIIAGIFVFICLFFSFFTVSAWHLVWLGLSANFLFVLIIIIAAMVMIINDSRVPNQVNVELGPEGVKLERISTTMMF